MRLTIKTDRLTLRVPQDDDAEALARGLGVLDIARMTARVPHPYPVEAAEAWIELQRAGRQRGDEISFVIEEQGRLCGGIGVFRPAPEHGWEVGYWVEKSCWGRGIATEALTAIVDWAREELGADQLTAGYFTDNPASSRVLEKAGFEPTGCEESKFSLARGENATCVGMARDLAVTVSAA